MGGGGVPSGGVTIVYLKGHGSLPPIGKPNSRVDLYIDDRKKQSRWYDFEGRAMRNRDYFHQNGDNTHFFPHDHIWDWNASQPRSPRGVLPDYERYPEGRR